MKTLRIQRMAGMTVAYGLLFGALAAAYSQLVTSFVPNLYAASTPISDTPMAVKNTAKSNIMFTIDSSGGTDVDVLLTTFNSMYYESGITPTNDPGNLNGHFFLFPLAPKNGVTAMASYRDANPVVAPPYPGPQGISQMLEGDVDNSRSNRPDGADWRARFSGYNPQYYNPSVTYKPWPGTDSSGMTFIDATPTAAKLDPYRNALGTMDLTSEVSTQSVAIDKISNANPGVVATVGNHNLVTGQVVLISCSAPSCRNINTTINGSTTPLDGGLYAITVIDATHFSLGMNPTTAGAALIPASTSNACGANCGTAYVNMAHTFLSQPAGGIAVPGTNKGWYYPSIWFPATYYMRQDTTSISSISNANPAVVTTATPHPFATGASVYITGVGGLTLINNRYYTITVNSTTQFSLQGIDTSASAVATTNTGTTSYGPSVLAGGGVRYEIRNPSVSCTPTDQSVDANGYYTTKIPGCNGGTAPFPPACAAGTKFPYTGCNPSTYPSGNTYSAEIQNFTNWFQYAHTPLLTLQGAIGKQLETLGSTRAGMIYLEKDITDPKSVQVEDMGCNVKTVAADGVTPVPCSTANQGPGNLNNLRNRLYDFNSNLSDWRQPIHERMSHVFNYFKQTGSASLAAPIQYACQQNFDIIATPGYLNEGNVAGSYAAGYTNYFTGTNPQASAPFNSIGDYDSTAGVGTGSGTLPYADVSSSNPPGPSNPPASDTLADWALYIYNQNLRPDLATGQVPPTPSAHETNTNPHLTTYVMAPGAIPTLGNAPRFLIPAMTDPYTIAPPIDWPRPVYVDESTVDDLWHATVNGRGMFINNTDIYAGLTTILNDIMGRSGAAAAVAVSNANISPGDNFSYASTYNSGNWSGDLQATPISLTTGQPDPTNPKWVPSAQGQLDATAASSRLIATYDSANSRGLPFQWANLTAAMQATLNSPTTPPGPSDGASVLSFLRGDRSKEGTGYRTRGHVLGDIINAEPVIVREPLFGYIDAGYLAFKQNYTNTAPRTKMVYQPANDGMLHAFDAATGAERWAYVPGLLFNTRMHAPGPPPSPNPYPNASTLVNLSLRSGFTHLYMVDGTPAQGDVDFNYTYTCNPGCAATPSSSTTANWHTILVGGFRKGGVGYYTLDVTNPVVADEATLASQMVMWEFPTTAISLGAPSSLKANVGYSYGKPVIVKTNAAGWVVLVTSGYNNGTDDSATNPNGGGTGGDGQGHLFVLNAATGALIKDIPTGAGTSTTPSGLANIAAWADNGNINRLATQVYGGDLLGNVWRFDLSGPIANWSATQLATLTDASGNPQPVTTIPQLALAGVKRMVYVGTGKYLVDGDVTSTQVQTMYGLADTYDQSNPANIPATLVRSNLTRQTLAASQATPGARTVTATPPGAGGWYLDLTLDPSGLSGSGERIVTNPKIAYTTLIFTSNTPSNSNACTPGGVTPMLYTLDYMTGGAIGGSTANAAVQLSSSGLASDPQLVMLPNGTIVAIIRKSDATTIATTVTTKISAGTGKRVSWREILQQ